VLPAAVGLPLAFGAVQGVPARSNVLSFDVASWTRTAGVMLLLVVVAIRAARSLDRLEAERDGRESKLRVSEARLRMMVGDVRDYAILMLDTQGKVATWNAGAERFKGYKADEIIGQHFSVFYVPDDVAAGKPARELEVAAADGRLEDEGWRVRKDGTRFWANVVITALRDSDGVLCGYGKITRDLSDREQARIELEQATASSRSPMRSSSSSPMSRRTTSPSHCGRSPASHSCCRDAMQHSSTRTPSASSDTSSTVAGECRT
jgi:PAS domain S-box-containing protein